MAKFEKGAPRPAGAGRKPGVPNKLAVSAKEAIELAAQGLGGHVRIEAWAKEAPENEKAFWTTIYPKLLPLQVTGAGGNTPVAVSFSVQPVKAVRDLD